MLQHLGDLLTGDGPDGPRWSHTSAQLNINVIRLSAGATIPPHRNAEVDVLLLIMAGSGSATVDKTVHSIRAGDLLVIPRGAERSVHSTSDDFAYVTCHQRRAGLQPQDKQVR
jgi:quercetin dioxygenase-like cupin family protein